MGLQNDWVLHQIEMITQFVSRVVFKKDSIQYNLTTETNVQNYDALSNTDLLYFQLKKLIKQGKICEAEDLLFDCFEYTDKYIELTVDFYQTINNLSDQQLEKYNFSRDEIYDGLTEILKKLNIPFADLI